MYIYVYRKCMHICIFRDGSARTGVFRDGGGGVVLAGVGLKLAEGGFRGKPHVAFALSRYWFFITKQTCAEAFGP